MLVVTAIATPTTSQIPLKRQENESSREIIMKGFYIAFYSYSLRIWRTRGVLLLVSIRSQSLVFRTKLQLVGK